MMPAEPPQPDRPGREALKRLLSARNQEPDRVAAIDAEIRATFGREVAILALDMCGFTALTARLGIIHFLAMIHEMEEAARPAVEGNGGRVVKQEADNLFAIFDDPAQALEGAIDILRSFQAVNTVVPDERDLYASIGIGYGEALVIGAEDVFGHEMNLACKLGEDLAGPGEILLTPAAHAALPPGRYLASPASYRVSGVEIACFRFDGVADRGSAGD
jgi:adenylate cyclase